MRKQPKRKVERETSRRGRATAAKLIEFASKELDRVGPAKFDIDSVLRKSKMLKSISFKKLAVLTAGLAFVLSSCGLQNSASESSGTETAAGKTKNSALAGKLANA